jgi:histidyl-tRNA synthetase
LAQKYDLVTLYECGGRYIMALITKAPRGTLDKLPDDSYKYRFVENAALSQAAKFGYRELRTPVFEHTELFRRSVGDTTDIVQKEMYTFDDKKGRSLTLKPEGTAPLARAVIENGLLNEALPLKLCYITNCYRYEAPQSGRYREFTQFGAEVYGANSPLCDAELIALAYDLFRKLGLAEDSYSIEVNTIGCSDCRGIYQKALREYYGQFKARLCGDCLERIERNPMRLLDCKVESCGEFKGSAPLISDYNCESCLSFFAIFERALKNLAIPYVVNPKIVRGLDYYCNTVFEFVANSGLVFGGGGRYNGLVRELGGADTPASGFALGIERLVSLTEAHLPHRARPDIYIGAMGEAATLSALEISCRLRRNGLEAHCDIIGRSVKAQMRFADKTRARYSMVIGDSELESGVVVLKNMSSKETRESKLDVREITELLRDSAED